MKSFYWLLKRELWEHRSFLIVPALIGAAAIIFMLVGVLQVEDHSGNASMSEHFQVDDVVPEKRHIAAIMVIMVTAFPFNVMMLILIGTYLLDALYGERRDRSILFWKSLPVSDTAVVLSKLATATLVAPFITLAVIALTQFIVLVIVSIGFLLLGLEGWGWIWNPAGWLLGWASLGYGYILLSLVLLPYLAWLLLASAWARRAPFLWAAVPPAALIVLELFFLGSSHAGQWIFGHMRDLMPQTFNLPAMDLLTSIDEHREMAIQPGPEFFAQPELWGGIFVAGLFTSAAIWLRRYRDET